MTRPPRSFQDRHDLLLGIACDLPGHRARTQRLRLLAAIAKVGAVSEEECKEFLRCSYPAERIRELQEWEGIPIATVIRFRDSEYGPVKVKTYDLPGETI